MRARGPSRDEVLSIIEDARAKKRNKRDHVRAELAKLHPDLVGRTIRRNGNTYDAIEYILGDIDSYGTSS